MGDKIFFSLAPLANLVLYPHLKIRGAAHAHGGREGGSGGEKKGGEGRDGKGGEGVPECPNPELASLWTKLLEKRKLLIGFIASQQLPTKTWKAQEKLAENNN